MRAFFFALLLAGCGHTGNADGGAPGDRCDPDGANTCRDGLVCCRQCRGTPFPPDFGLEGNCTSNCPAQLCP